jgi:hypothetical protein
VRDDQKPEPSLFWCALAGIGGAAAVVGAMRLLAGPALASSLAAFSGAAVELERAVEAYDQAVVRLQVAEAALELVRVEYLATPEADQGEILPSLKAAMLGVRIAREELDAATRRMQDWNQVVALERKAAKTAVGQDVDRLLRELGDVTVASRKN